MRAGITTLPGRFVSTRSVCLALAALVVSASTASAQVVEIVQTFFVPITEEQCYSAMRAISVGSYVELAPTNVMFSAWGLVPSETNTVIFFDQWEDGYEGNITSPTQATTEVWGDGNAGNGIPPGFAQDYVNAGDYISLTNTMSVPRDLSQIRYDGRDKLMVTKPIATTRAQYAVDPGQVLAGAVQAPDTTRFGTEFVAPVGTNTSANNAFTYCSMSVIAAKDDTLVSFDANADGTDEMQVWLNQGETYMITNIAVGARAKSSRPIQAHLLTGNVGSYYQMRWFMLFPSYQWDDVYYAPVGSRTNADGGVTYVTVHLYNPHTSNMTVRYQTASGSGSVTVPARANASYQMPFETGGRFYATNGMTFLAIAQCDSGDQSREWGYGLMPADMLTTMAICGWGQGSGDLTQNGSPVWVSATSNTTLYVDFDSNPNTGANIDPLGRRYDISTNVSAYETAIIYDTINNDKDQTATRVYTLSNFITTAWGEDPRSSLTGNPYLDMGCEILPMPTVLAEKRHVLFNDLNGNLVTDPGDQIEYTITLRNVGWVSANNVIIYDAVPLNTAYNAGSSKTNGFSISDNTLPSTPFPFDETGWVWGSLPVGTSGTLSYVVSVTNAFPTNQDNVVVNNAHVTSHSGGTGTQDPEPVNRGGLLITKTADPTNRVYAGSNITYTITVQNTGTFAQTMVRIGDTLPSGVNNPWNLTEPPGTNTVLDEFSDVSYANNDGTENWSSDWVENDPYGTAGPVGNYVGVTGGRLFLTYIYVGEEWIQRSADISGASSAQLSFDWETVGLTAGKTISVLISSNSGATYTTLDQLSGTASGTTNYNITAYISSGTQIRFVNQSINWASGEYAYFDNVQIQYSTTGGVASVVTGRVDIVTQEYVTNTVSDAFNAISYANNNGTVNWLGDWEETGESDGANAGSIRVVNQWSAYNLRILREVRSVSRFVDLGGYTNAVFSFDYRRILMDPADTVRVYASSNGGASWTQIGTINGPASGATDTSTLSSNANITAFISTNTGIRFSIPVRLSNGEGIAFDNVQILFTRYGAVTNSGVLPPVMADGYTLNPGEYMSVVVETRVDSPITATQFVNSAWVLSAQNLGRIYAYATNYPVSADLALSKTVSNASPNTNDLIGYRIVLTNRGPDTATNIVVRDLLPSGVTFVSNSVSQGTYSGITGIWTAGTVNVSGFATLWITGRVAAGTGGQTITNRARISRSSVVDPITTNNTSSVPITVQSTDLGVTKTVDALTPATNQLLTFTIVLTNNGPQNATTIRVTDLLPTGLTYVSNQVSQGVYNQVSGIWTVNTVNAGSSVNMRLYARVNAGTENSSITNWARITQLDQQDINLANNSNSAVIAVSGLDIGVSKTADNYTPNTNDVIVYRIAVTNFGPSGASGLQFTDAVPVGVTYLGHGTSTGSYSSVTAIWTVSNLGIGASGTLTITGRVAAGTAGSYITNTVSLSALNQADYKAANNVSSAVIRVQSADLAVFKSVDKVLANESDTISFTITLTNNGPSAASGIVVTDSVPSGVTYASAVPSQGTYTPASGMWTVGTVSAFSTATLTLHGTVNTGTTGQSITNRVRIIGAQQYDPVLTNNTNAVAFTVINARMGISKVSVATNPLYFDDIITYTIAVTNYGNIAQTGLTISDPSPSGSTYVAGSSKITAPLLVTNTVADYFNTAVYNANNGTTNWIANWDEAGTDDENAAAGDIQILVQNLRITNPNNIVRRMASLRGATNAVLSFLYRGDSLDGATDYVAIEISSNGYGGTWTQLGRIIGPATDAFFTSTNFDITAYASTNVAIRFSSSGTMAADDYVWLDDVKITYMGRFVVTVDGGTPAPVVSGYTLRTNESLSVTFQVAVANPTTQTQVLNTASVTSAQHLATLNAFATDRVARADLVVNKSVNNATPTVGALVEYYITVTNKGPDEARGVKITDVLPVGMTYSNSVASSGAYDRISGVWTVGTVAVSGSASLTLRARVTNDDAWAGITITNLAVASGRRQIEVTTTNDQGSVTLTPRPTLVVVTGVKGFEEGGVLGLEWETALEVGTVGFNVYREVEDGGVVQVNSRLLPGLVVAEQGGVYRLVDGGAKSGQTYRYWIEEVENGGRKTRYGPYAVTMKAGVKKLTLKNNAPASYSRTAKSESAEKAARAAARSESVEQTKSLSLMDEGNLGKVGVTETGMKYVRREELATVLALPEAYVGEMLSKGYLELRKEGVRVGYLPAGSNGRGMYFYGEGLESIYSDENMYGVGYGQNGGVGTVWGGNPAPSAGNPTYRDVAKAEENHYSAPALFSDAEADVWLWDYLSAGVDGWDQRDFEVELNGVRKDHRTAIVKVKLLGGTKSGVADEHHAVVWLNGTQIGEEVWSGEEWRTVEQVVDQALLVEGANTVTVKAVLGGEVPYSLVYVEDIEVNYARYYRAKEDELRMRGDGHPVVTISGFTSPRIAVVDVGDAAGPKVVRGVRVDGVEGDYRVSFMPTDGSRNYVAFVPGVLEEPAVVAAGDVSGLTSWGNRGEYVVITVEELKAAAEELAAYREGQGYSTKVVTLEEIYDAFGYGVASPYAIKAFVRYAYAYWEEAPRYVVLVGDGTYDYKDYKGYGDNVVPPKVVSTPHGLFESDGWYGDVEGDDGVPEVMVGRLPVLTTGELTAVIGKIKGYEAASGGWETQVGLVADDGDEGGKFEEDSDALGGWIPGGYVKNRVYLSELGLSGARSQLTTLWNSGLSLVNYLGHGGLDRFTAEGLVTSGDVGGLTNGEKLPVVLALTCAAGRYSLPGFDCLGEALVMREGGGAVAVWAPTGLSMNDLAKRLDEGYLRARYEEGETVLGEVVGRAMEGYGTNPEERYMLYIYNLLGDPALRIK